MKIKRLLLALSLRLAVAGTTVLPNFATSAYAEGGGEETAKCNSGRCPVAVIGANNQYV